MQYFLNLFTSIGFPDAKEARNKDIKRCRENNIRKSTPIHTNEDIIHFLLISSDPYIFKFKTRT